MKKLSCIVVIVFFLSVFSNTVYAENVDNKEPHKIDNSLSQSKESNNKTCENTMNYSGQKLRSNEQIDFCERFSGKTVLIVNTASQCGYTPQFEGLESLYQKYKDKGLEVVGFPSGDFNQEYAEAEKTASLCYENYGVTFTMMETGPVKGEKANTLFQWLAKESGEQPAWNFNKYLVNNTGSVKHYGSSQKPLAGDIEQDIRSALKLK